MATQEDVDKTAAQLLRATIENNELEGAMKVINAHVSKSQRKVARRQKVHADTVAARDAALADAGQQPVSEGLEDDEE